MVEMFMVVKNEDGVYMPKELCGDFYILPSDLSKALDDLIEYYNDFSDEYIADCNNYINGQIEEALARPKTDEERQAEFLRKIKNKKGYVYLLKCADKYKIGFSKDVERRVKQLNNRPFEVELVQKWYYERAFDIEQELHTIYEKFKVDPTGEWYNLNLPVNQLGDSIEKLKEKYPTTLSEVN